MGHWETRVWETCDIEVWDTTRDLVFPVTKDRDVVKSVSDTTGGRRTNFIVSPEILRFIRQLLEEETPEDEPTECIRTLRELVNKWYQEEDTMETTYSEEDMDTGGQNLVTQSGWCPMQNAWVTSWNGGGKGCVNHEGHKGRNRNWEPT